VRHRDVRMGMRRRDSGRPVGFGGFRGAARSQAGQMPSSPAPSRLVRVKLVRSRRWHASEAREEEYSREVPGG
jgi:hypothetical protein